MKGIIASDALPPHCLAATHRASLEPLLPVHAHRAPRSDSSQAPAFGTLRQPQQQLFALVPAGFLWQHVPSQAHGSLASALGGGS